MKLPELCIRRPVLAIVINLIIVLLGLVCYERLSLREYPKIDLPEVTVEVRYPGAAADIMETQVVKPLENSLSGIEGVDYIKSISRAELAQITVRFQMSRDPDDAAADVRDRVGRVRGALPDEIDEPVVSKAEADAQPILWLSVNSERHSTLEVSEMADLVVQDRLEVIPGVSSVRIFAERRPSMRIWLDADKLAAYELSAQEIENALRAQNVEIPSGRIESAEREFTVLTQTDLNTPQQFAAIIVKRTEGGHLVRMQDVARVEVGPKEERSLSRFNGKNSVSLGIIKQSTANPLDISNAVKEVLPELQKSLPEGMVISRSYDSSVFIDESLTAVMHTIAEATLLVVLVIFLFLRSMRATLIPLVTIPVSLIGALALMYVMGFSINTLTLLAMVIAIGLVVDDAIVVLENIYRHIEEGMDSIHAAVKGVREIGFAVVAMTLTLAAVFAPISFSSGRTGRLFVEFALTLAGAVLVSGFIALTLSPMMCSRWLKPHEGKQSNWSIKIDQFLHALDARYKAALTRALNRKGRIVAMAAGFIALSAFLFIISPSELSPPEDRGVLFVISSAPEGSTLEYVDIYASQLQTLLTSVPEHRWDFMAVGFPTITNGFSVLGLDPWDDRSRSSLQIIETLKPKLFGITGTFNIPINPASLGQGGRTQPVEFIIQTTEPYAELNRIVGEVMVRLQKNQGISFPDTDLKLNKPEIKVKVNREKIAALGIDVSVIGRTLETMLGGREVTRFKRNGEQYDVMVQMEENERRNPMDLIGIFIRAGSGEMVQLSNIVTLEESVAPRELNHFNKLRAATITANLSPGMSLGEALKFLETTVKEVAPTALVDYGGTSREYKLSSASIGLIFALALAFIYLVLAAQFESFRDSLIILLTVPLAMCGALLAMRITGGSLNVYSQIGLIALIGLIAKHGILIVEFANQLQDRGMDRLQAVVDSAHIRLRPILMTTAAMVLGALPLALSSGAGAESRRAIGWVLVGGMSFGTLMTLFVVPALYLLLSSPRKLVVIDESKV